MFEQELVLASASPRRAELLTLAGFRFVVDPADVDETEHPGERPEDYVLRVARDKAQTVAGRRPGRIILAADKSFTAKAAGTLNTETGAVVMQGSVIRGFLKDACFLEQGQLVDPIASRFQGSIKLVHGGCD